MRVRTKKQNTDGVCRIDATGELREILVNEDLMEVEQTTISLCFRGPNNSGIIDLSKKEIDILNEEISKKILNKVKIVKYKK